MNISTKLQINSIIQKYKVFLFDCDGVLWKSGKKIEENFWILNHLQEQQKQIYFISNNCMRSREEILNRFHDYGYKAQINQIYLSSSILAQHISSEYPQIKNVYAIGKKGLYEELRNVNLNVIEFDKNLVIDHSNAREIIKEKTQNIDAVIVGYDNEFNYMKQCLAANTLINNKGNCKFFATENTNVLHFGEFIKMPSVGCLAKSIQTVAQCADPIVVSKPETGILQLLESKFQLKKEDMIMIGDKLDTDIEMARRYEIDSLLVFTGELRKQEFQEEIQHEMDTHEQWVKYKKHNNFYMLDSFLHE